MNSPSLPTPSCPLLPPWNQPSQDRRRELAATLAALILKQLPPRATTPSEVRDERP